MFHRPLSHQLYSAARQPSPSSLVNGAQWGLSHTKKVRGKNSALLTLAGPDRGALKRGLRLRARLSVLGNCFLVRLDRGESMQDLYFRIILIESGNDSDLLF